MAITIPDSTPEESLNYNRIFVDNIEIRQLRTAEFNVPLIKVVIRYRKLAITNEGKAVYHHSNKMITLDDYMKQASEEAAQGNTSLLNAFLSIEQAIGSVIKDDTGEDIIVQ